MTLTELTVTKDALRKQLQEYEQIKPNCINCTKYTHDKCEQFDASPPNSWKIGPVQCEHWVWDQIPF